MAKSKSNNKEESDSLDMSSKLLNLQESILDVLKKQTDQMRIMSDQSEKLVSYLKENRKFRKEEKDSQDKTIKFLKEHEEFEDKIKYLKEDQLDTSKKLSEHAKYMSLSSDVLVKHASKYTEQVSHTSIAMGGLYDTLSKIGNAQELSSKSVEDLISTTARLNNITEMNADVWKQIVDQDITSGQYQSIDLGNIRKEQLKAEIDLKSLLNSKDAEALKGVTDQMRANIELQNNALNLAEEFQKRQKNTASVIKSVGSGVEGIGHKITGAFEKMPGGAHIAKMLNIDGLAENIKNKLGKGLANVFDGMADSGIAKFKLIGGLVGGLALGIGGFLLHSLMEVDQEVSEIGKEFGISRQAAMDLHHSAIELADEMQIVGVNSKEVAKGIMSASQLMGGMDIATAIHEGNEAAKQLVKDVTVLSEKFGMSNEEIKSIQDIATITGKSMGQLTMEATALGKGLMNNKEAMKALASIPKSVTIAFKGGTQELIKAAQKAKLLGMELGRVQDIGDGMMDIEQSLGKEMEARALTGKNLNLDAARMLALQGDTAGLQDEILKQAGSLQDFQKMNRIQQKAFADAMGMSVDEMTGMLTGAQKMKDLGMSSAQAAELQAMNAEDLRKTMANTSDEKQKAYIEQLAKEKESATLQERFQNILKKVQEKLSALLTPILEMLHGLMDSATAGDNLNGIIEGVVGAIKMVIPIIKYVAVGFGVLLGYITPIFSIVKSIVEFMQKFSKGTEAAGASVKPVEAGFGNILAILGAIGAYFFGKKLLGKGMDMLKDKAADVGKTIMDKIGGSMGKVTDKSKGMLSKAPKGKAGGGGGLGDKIADFVNKIDAKKLMMSAAAILILAAALWVAAKAFQEFGKTNWEGIAKGVVGLLALVGVAYLISKIEGEIIAGSVALLILSAALYVMSLGFEKFGGMDWSAIEKGVVAIIAVAGVAALIGLAAPLVIIGAAALLLLGGALVVFRVGLNLMGAAAEKIGPLIEGLFSQFAKLLSLDPTKLPLIASGIVLIAAALGTLALAAGAGGAAAGIGSAIAGLFGSKGPMEMVMEISEKIQPQKLSDTAKSIRDLADAFKYFAEETSKLKDFDISKIDAIIEKMEDMKEAQSGGVGGALMSAAKGITGFIGNIFGSSQEQKSESISDSGGATAGNEKDKMDTVISLLTQLVGSTSQPTVIKFGDKTVEEIKTVLNFKKAYNIGIDNSYGRSV